LGRKRNKLLFPVFLFSFSDSTSLLIFPYISGTLDFLTQSIWIFLNLNN